MFSKLFPLGLNKVFSVFGIALTVATTTATSAMVVQKVFQDPQPIEIQSVQASEAVGFADEKDQEADIQLGDKELAAVSGSGSVYQNQLLRSGSQIGEDDNNYKPLPESASDTQTAIANSEPTSPAESTASSGSFTSETLAQYDGRNGQCYIALNGIVYDVTDYPSWSDCTHHGIRGGQDITSVFPHSTGFLSGLPIVGTYDDGTGQQSAPARDISDDDGDEDEEDDDEDEEDGDEDEKDDDGYEDEDLQDQDDSEEEDHSEDFLEGKTVSDDD